LPVSHQDFEPFGIDGVNDAQNTLGVRAKPSVFQGEHHAAFFGGGQTISDFHHPGIGVFVGVSGSGGSIPLLASGIEIG
jgi:hypothetical protein